MFIRVTWLIYMCDITDSYVWRDSFARAKWLIGTCDMTNSYVWHISFTGSARISIIPMTWLICMCDMTHSYKWHDSVLRVTWLIHRIGEYKDRTFYFYRARLMSDITHSYAWHDSFVCVTWLVQKSDMTQSHVWHDAFTGWARIWIVLSILKLLILYVLWLIHMCDMTHSYVWRDSIRGVAPGEMPTTPCHIIYVDESCHTCEWVTSHI